MVDERRGFRSVKSTTTTNVVFRTYILDTIKKRGQVDVIYIDFRKAFDTVDHDGILLRKIEFRGLGNPLFAWLKSYFILFFS